MAFDFGFTLKPEKEPFGCFFLPRLIVWSDNDDTSADFAEVLFSTSSRDNLSIDKVVLVACSNSEDFDGVVFGNVEEQG